MRCTTCGTSSPTLLLHCPGCGELLNEVSPADGQIAVTPTGLGNETRKSYFALFVNSDPIRVSQIQALGGQLEGSYLLGKGDHETTFSVPIGDLLLAAANLDEALAIRLESA